jgi:hypothetical protein
MRSDDTKIGRAKLLLSRRRSFGFHRCVAWVRNVEGTRLAQRLALPGTRKMRSDDTKIGRAKLLLSRRRPFGFHQCLAWVRNVEGIRLARRLALPGTRKWEAPVDAHCGC